jgi:hypothetical protein
MDIGIMERRLARAFTARPVEIGDGRIVWRSRPAPLWRYLEEGLDKEERAEYGPLQHWPGSVMELLDERRQKLLSFYWDGLGPISWVAGIEVLVSGERAYLCYWNEVDTYVAVAALARWDHPLVICAAVKELLRENGRPHGVDVFGSLPTETTNCRPDLLPEEVIRKAYFRLAPVVRASGRGRLAHPCRGALRADGRAQAPAALLRSAQDPASPRRAGGGRDLVRRAGR